MGRRCHDSRPSRDLVRSVGDLGFYEFRYPDWMARTKKPKVQIKRQKTSLGWAYRIYINGSYMATSLTQASARDCTPVDGQHSLKRKAAVAERLCVSRSDCRLR